MNDTNTTAAQTALQVYSYEGSNITFSKGENVMINANEMAKPFGKRATHWLNNQQTKEFLQELSSVRNLTLTELVQVKNGGDNRGTWMHEDVAMEFARWLSPKFAIWTNDRIKELLTQGVTTVSNDDAAIAYAMDVLQKRLESKQEQVEFQQRQLEIVNENVRLQQDYIKQLQAKADYTTDVLCSKSNYTFTQIAADLGFRSVHALMDALHSRHIVYKQSRQWLPTARYNLGVYFATRTSCFVRHDGTVGTSLYTVVTEAGRAMLHSIFDGTDKNAIASKKGGAR